MERLTVLQIIGACALLAAIPAGVWGYIFFRKKPEDRFHARLTFIVGALAVFPILLYKVSWEYFPWLNILAYTKRFDNDFIGLQNFVLIPVSVILTFMIVGVIEEVMKQSVVHAVDDHRINQIDDAIEFSIMAALGFSFTENILYFYTIWVDKGPDALFIPFIFRSLFSTFAHVLFSGIFGYFYGIAHFAKPILQKELQENRSTLLKWFHKIFRSKTDELFHEQKMLEGLVLAIILHAIYNVFLEMNWTFIMVPYLFLGYLILSHLLEKKENHKVYEKLYIFERNHPYPPHRVAFHLSKVVKKLKQEKT